MREIHGTVMHYPWGTTDAIPAILGVPADGRPFAEYWLGAHPLAPSQLDGRRLDEVLAGDEALLGPLGSTNYGERLPFMVKLLSARHALSLQAHPPRGHAEEGYAREESRGLALDDPKRVYKDPNPKPELLVALTDFQLLGGFRAPQATTDLFAGLGVAEVVEPLIAPLNFRKGRVGIEQVFLDMLASDDDRDEQINQVLVAAVAHADDPDEVGDFARLIIELDAHFPADPGILAACLMNHVTLEPGEAVFLPSGVLHAYLSGTGVEVLANSDNVIRAGLTGKHIAVDELVSVVDFEDAPIAVLHGAERQPGCWAYPSSCPEFDVWRLEPRSGDVLTLPAHGALRIALVTRGAVTLDNGADRLELEHGQAVLVPAGEPDVTVSGSGQVFVTAPGIR